MFYALHRATALGAKYGLKAFSMYTDSSVETPEIDESAMEGAVGVVVTLAAVIIALYITALVVGSMSKTIGVGYYNTTTAAWENQTTGLALPAVWNTTVRSLDTQAQSSFSLAGILPIAIVGIGVLVIIISAFAMR